MNEDCYRIRIKKGDFELELEGPIDFVESKLNEYSHYLEQPMLKSSDKEASNEKMKKDGIVIDYSGFKEFYLDKKPMSHNDRFLVFCYWLKRNVKIPEPSLNQIEACYDEIAIAKPNAFRDVARGLRKNKPALLMTGKQTGCNKITLDGEDYVENKLPKKKESKKRT